MALFGTFIGQVKERGQTLLQEGRWEQALRVWTECEEACAKSKDFAENSTDRINCLINMGIALAAMGRHQDSLVPFAEARSLLLLLTEPIASYLEAELDALTSSPPRLLTPTPEILALAWVDYYEACARMKMDDYEYANELLRPARNVFASAEEWKPLGDCQLALALSSYSLGYARGDRIMVALARGICIEARVSLTRANDRAGAAFASFTFAKMARKDQAEEAREAAATAMNIWTELGDLAAVRQVEAFLSASN